MIDINDPHFKKFFTSMVYWLLLTGVATGVISTLTLLLNPWFILLFLPEAALFYLAGRIILWYHTKDLI